MHSRFCGCNSVEYQVLVASTHSFHTQTRYESLQLTFSILWKGCVMRNEFHGHVGLQCLVSFSHPTLFALLRVSQTTPSWPTTESPSWGMTSFHVPLLSLIVMVWKALTPWGSIHASSYITRMERHWFSLAFVGINLWTQNEIWTHDFQVWTIELCHDNHVKRNATLLASTVVIML